MFGLFGAGKELAGDSSWGIAEFAEVRLRIKSIYSPHCSAQLCVQMQSHMPDNMRSPGPSAELQKLLDEDLGPSVRAVVYSYLLAPDASGMHGNHPAVALMCEHERIPAFQRTLWSRARNVVAQKMYQGMVRDAENIKKVHDTVDACVAKLDEMLPSLGPATIAPGVPSRVHLAIAALLSPLVMPNHALTAFYGQELLTIDVIPAEMAALVHKYRATNVGKMIMQLYDECRMHGVKSAQ
jgi:hypothetical protein